MANFSQTNLFISSKILDKFIRVLEIKNYISQEMGILIVASEAKRFIWNTKFFQRDNWSVQTLVNAFLEIDQCSQLSSAPWDSPGILSIRNESRYLISEKCFRIAAMSPSFKKNSTGIEWTVWRENGFVQFWAKGYLRGHSEWPLKWIFFYRSEHVGSYRGPSPKILYRVWIFQLTG